MKNLRCLCNLCWHLALKASHFQALSRQHIRAGTHFGAELFTSQSGINKRRNNRWSSSSMNGFTALMAIPYVSRAEESPPISTITLGSKPLTWAHFKDILLNYKSKLVLLRNPPSKISFLNDVLNNFLFCMINFIICLTQKKDGFWQS